MQVRAAGSSQGTTICDENARDAPEPDRGSGVKVGPDWSSRESSSSREDVARARRCRSEDPKLRGAPSARTRSENLEQPLGHN